MTGSRLKWARRTTAASVSRLSSVRIAVIPRTRERGSGRTTTRAALVAAALLCSVVAGAQLVTGAAQAAPQGPSASGERASASLLDINRRLTDLASAAGGHQASSAGVTSTIRALAAKRRQLLASLVSSSPATAQQFILSADTLSRLDGVAGDLLERSVTLRGTYLDVAGPAPSGRDGDIREVTTASGTFTLTSAGSFPPIVSGSGVEVTGDAIGNTVLVEAAGGTASGLTVTSSSPADAGMTGPTPVAVLLATFSDTTTAPTIAAEQAAFSGSPGGGDVDSWYAAASYGRTSVNPSFFGPFPLNETSATGCSDINALAQTIITTASSSVTFSSFTRLMFIVDCSSIGGLATVGTTSVSTPQGTITAGETWIGPGGWTSVHTLVHELGHNAGMSHADWVICQPDVFDAPGRLGPNCVPAPYGDPFDVMGQPSGSASHPDAYHTALAGWFTAANDPIVTASGTTSYTVAPIETASSGAMALTIPRGNTGTSWTVEYRQPIGSDAWMSTCGLASGCNVTSGASIKINGAFPGSSEDTHAVDMTPESQPLGSTYWPTQDLEVDGALLPGHSFTDPEFGIVISVTGASASGLSVNITIPTQSCTRAAPAVSLPASSFTLAPATALTTTLTLTDADSSGCAPQRFRYQGSGYADPGLVTLNPGATATMSVTYTPPNLGYGYYTFNPSVVPDSLASPPASPAATIIVSGPSDTTSPTTPPYLTAQARGSATVSLHWAPSTDTVGLTGYHVYRDGALVATASTNAYLDTAASGTSHSYTVAAVNESSVESALSAPAAVTMPAATDTTAPSAPSGLGATSVTGHSLVLQWTAATDNVGVAYYEVMGPPGGAVIVDPTATSLTVTALQSSTATQLYVLAFDGAGNASDFWSSFAAAVTPTTAASGTLAPPAPLAPLITGYGRTHASLSWQAVTDAAGVTGYTLYRNSLRLTTVTGTSYTDNALNWCGNCQYAVVANDAAGNVSAPVLTGSVSGGSTATPTESITAPSAGATVATVTPVSVTAAAPAGIASVSVYDDGRMLGTSTTAPYSVALDPQWTANGSHTLLAIARDAVNDLNASAPVTVTTSAPDTTAPAAPAILEGYAAAPTQVSLQWSAALDNVGVTSYTVLRDGAAIATVSTTSFLDNAVAAASTHTYQLRASDAAGNVSASSPTLTVTTMASSSSGPTPTPTPTPTASPTPTTSSTTQPGAITGAVVNSRDRPVSGCSVTISGSGQTYVTTTSSTGAFQVGGLAPATYTVTAETRFSSASAAVTVTSGSTSSVTITVKK